LFEPEEEAEAAAGFEMARCCLSKNVSIASGRQNNSSFIGEMKESIAGCIIRS